jgi:hypothetical protein
MKKRGWSPETFVPGDAVIVEAHPGRNMALIYSVEKAGVTRPGRGVVEETLTGIEASQAEADGLPGTWIVLQTLLVRYFSEPFSQ